MSRPIDADRLKVVLEKNYGHTGGASVLAQLIDEQPTIQPERKKGKWKRHNTYRGDDTSGYVDPDWRCSECGKRANINECFMYDLTDFCPNCGADMREG